MGLYFKFLLLALLACQIQFNNGDPTKLTTAEAEALMEAWIGPRFNENEYSNVVAGITYTHIQSGQAKVSAADAAKPLEALNWREKDVPAVSSEQLKEIFTYIRYTKFLRTENRVRRRLSWLYPDEGCECRAELATRAIFQKNLILPKKIFVFGKPLRAATENTLESSKTIGWANHVALIYRVGDTPCVLDPSLDDKIPFTLGQWNDALLKNSADLTYSICGPTTFGRDEDCYQGRVWPHVSVLYHQIPLLVKEWERLDQLKRFPERELATCTPYV